MHVTLIDAWRRLDPRHAADAQWYWRARGVSARERQVWQGDICALAYVGGAFAGVATASLEHVPQARARMAVYRCEIMPDFRGRGMSYRLTGFARRGLERWSAAHPREQVMGLAAVLGPHDYPGRQREPSWPGLGLNLAGYLPDGRQLRLAWFRHARVADG